MTDTKALLRISSLRDSATASALRADSSTAEEDTLVIAAMVVACRMRNKSAFNTNSLCILCRKRSCWRQYSTLAEVVGRMGSCA